MSNNENILVSSSSSPTGKVSESLSSSSTCSTINKDGDCQSQLSIGTSSFEGETPENDQSSNQESPQPSSSGNGRIFSVKILRKPPASPVPIFTTHDCSPLCSNEENRIKELKGVKVSNHAILINRVNPYCVPNFLGWHRTKSEGWIVYTSPCGKKLNSLRQVYQYLLKTESGLSIDQFTFHSQLKLHTGRENFKAYSYVADVSEGKENVPIPCINEIDSSIPVGDFIYIAERIAGPNINLESDPEFLAHCLCQDRCKNSNECSCHGLSRDEAYMISGLDSVNQSGYKYKYLNKKLVSAVFECNINCTCDSRCLNRVVQNGIKHHLQVFKTSNRGWGLRCLHDIPPGSFICLYAGEIIDFETVNETDRINDYIAALDYIEEGRRPKRDFDTASDIDSVLDSVSSSSDVELSSCEGISNSSIIDDLSDSSDDEGNVDGIKVDNIEVAPSINNQIASETVTGDVETSAAKHDDSSLNNSQNDSSKRSHPMEEEEVGVSGESGQAKTQNDVSKRPKKDDETVPVIDLEEELINEVLHSQDLDTDDVIIDFDSMDQSRISSSREGERGTTIDNNHENNAVNGDDIDEVEEDAGNNPESVPVILKHLDMTHSYSIDGARYGNIGRFLNHSCEPNCRIRNIFVDNHDYRFPKLAFFSTRLIKAYEELTWDYRYPPDIPYSDSKVCLCGSPMCRGRIY